MPRPRKATHINGERVPGLSPAPLTGFAGDWLDGQSQLGVGGDGQRLVAWGKGRDHDIRHVDLLRVKKARVILWGPIFTSLPFTSLHLGCQMGREILWVFP